MYASYSEPQQSLLPGFGLVWSEEFDQPIGSGPDPALWVHDLGAGGWGNSELQTYVSDLDHCRIVVDDDASNGQALELRATKSSVSTYSSARIKTLHTKHAGLAYIEVRIKSPRGRGIWPAFWMMGEDIESVPWPQCGEIDVMEIQGHSPRVVHCSLHGPAYSGGAAITSSSEVPADEAFDLKYHTFGVMRSPNTVSFTLDGSVCSTWSVNDLPSGAPWVFNKPFFFLLNLAVGGSWPGYPDETTSFPQSLRVDYIRVYELLAPPDEDAPPHHGPIAGSDSE